MLTANINLIFPAWSKSWTIVNNCTGAFSVTCKTPSGTGIAVAAGSTVRIIGNGTNIISNESPLITGALQKSANLSDLANVQTALANLTLTDMGIGLPSMTVIANFDWQNFVFTSGANYLTAYNTWINPPAGITYNAGDNISVRVEYVYGNRIGLRLTPDTGAAANFKVYELLCVGAAGSRVFTFNQDWNSAIPVPITGGGTGGKTAAEALTNLGLGEGSLVPIGIPLPYPLATPPTGFLKVNGSSFSAATYPKLALAYPSGVLPDLRGEFIRGFDDGRGVRADQNLLGWQGGAIQSHNHGLSNFEIRGLTGGPTPGWFTSVNGLSTSDSGGDETRPRNIAFNYIVRAI
ncbi:TPA: tail fiber protein [Yersinia enterocolitica]|nr:tail fiber protein [Yersinia enterocolitica]